MGFQSTVSLVQGFGVPGEQFSDSPWRAQSFSINSASAAYNIIGATACTVTSQGVCQAGSGGTLGYAGILAAPKEVALFGTSGSPLSPTLTVPNFTQIECMTMGQIIATLPASASIGDWVIFDNTTGALSTVAPTTSLPGGKSWAYAVVDNFTVTAASGVALAVLTLNPGIGVPT